MRFYAAVISATLLFVGCSDDVRGGPWQISEGGNSGTLSDTDVSDDSTADAGDVGPEFLGEAYLLATALERIAVIARDRHSPLCVAIVLVWPSGPGIYDDVQLSDEWAVEGIVARPEGCPEEQWPASEGLRPDSATGQIDLHQSQAQDRYTSVGVDVALSFPENGRDVPREVVLDFSRLEL